jgi:HK97 family phage prohead protease
VPPREATIVSDHGNITAPNAGDLNEAARKYCASQGWAMADGSYPIRPADNHGAADAGKAIHAVGRGGSSGDSIRRHIIGRLHTIGQADMIPDTWNAKGALVEGSQTGMRSVATDVLDRVQYRFAADLELRAGGDGRTIVGIAVPWDMPQRIDPDLIESFDRNALDHQIRAMHRVGYWREHSVHGGAEVGHIKYARNDASGLYTESFISPDDPMGDQTLDEIRSGKLPHQSVGFECAPGGSQMRSGVTHRVKATLTELAAVPQGAYGDGAAVSGVRASASECPECALRVAEEAEQRLAQLRALAVSLPVL